MLNPTITRIPKTDNPIKGFKAFKRDASGNLYTDGYLKGPYTSWKPGQTRHIDVRIEELSLCGVGFHFFLESNLIFASEWVSDLGYTEIREVVVLGDVVTDTYKAVTNSLTVGEKVPGTKLEQLITELENRNSGSCNSGDSNSGGSNSGDRNSGDCNSGYRNSGNYNSGHRNSGDRNSGDRNSGNRNFGDCNSGNYNSGNYNSGDCNSGDCNSGGRNSGNRNSGNYNSGHFNSGYYNSGSRNSGHFNSGYYNSGNYNSGNDNPGNFNSSSGIANYFCTKPHFLLFDIEVDQIPEVLRYLDMSWFELDSQGYKHAWSKCPPRILDILRSIPEFQKATNKEKFFQITGLQI